RRTAARTATAPAPGPARPASTCRPSSAPVLVRVGDLAGSGDDVVDEAVLERLLRREPPVAVEVGDDPLDRLPGVLGDELGHLALVALEQLRLDGDVGLGAADARRRLVHEDLA